MTETCSEKALVVALAKANGRLLTAQAVKEEALKACSIADEQIEQHKRDIADLEKALKKVTRANEKADATQVA